jgi:hypothetical protein
MYNQTVTKSDGVWTYTPVKYWPSVDSPERVSFFAVSPAPSGTNGIAVATGADVAGYPAFTVTPPARPSQQADFCVATPVMNTTANDTNGSATGNGGGKVSFDFDHTMAKITFSAKYIYTPNATQPDDVDVYVDAIELSGLAGSNTLRITGAGYAWDTPQGTGAYTLAAADGELVTTKIVKDTEPAGSSEISTSLGTLCLLPQTISEDAVTFNVTLRVDGNIHTDKKKFPQGQWEAGKHYPYSFNVDVDVQVWTFAYTGSAQIFTAPENGYYRLEVWGAEGGTLSRTKAIQPGKGGYATGKGYFNKGAIVYVYVGGKGNGQTGGWNGGGTGTGDVNGSGTGGGGATDIRTDNPGTLTGNSSTDSRLIVAGGGGGGVGSNHSSAGTPQGNPGHGGGTNGSAAGGLNGTYGVGGTQTAGGAGGTAGAGGNGIDSNWRGGGGGGWFGGGYGSVVDWSGGGGGGGSAFIGKVIDGSTIGGGETMPDLSGGTMTGNSGDGYARIMLFGIKE